jgi:hypothetical protein
MGRLGNGAEAHPIVVRFWPDAACIGPPEFLAKDWPTEPG